MCSSGPVTCVTSVVATNVLRDRHIFGQQQAAFPDVPLHLDLVLVVRVYLDDGRSEAAAGNVEQDTLEEVADQRSAAAGSGTWNSPRAVSTSSRNSMEAKAGVPEENLTLVAWAFLPLVVHGKKYVFVICFLLTSDVLVL